MLSPLSVCNGVSAPCFWVPPSSHRSAPELWDIFYIISGSHPIMYAPTTATSSGAIWNSQPLAPQLDT